MYFEWLALVGPRPHRGRSHPRTVRSRLQVDGRARSGRSALPPDDRWEHSWAM